MVRPGIVVNPMRNRRIRIPCALGTEFPDAPILSMFAVQEIHQRVEGVAIRSFGVVDGRARSRNHYILSAHPPTHTYIHTHTTHTVICHIAKVQVGFGVLQSRTGHDLPQD